MIVVLRAPEVKGNFRANPVGYFRVFSERYDQWLYFF